MIKNESFVLNPCSFGFKDILFPEESKLQVEDKERLIGPDEANEIMDKINKLTPKEVNKMIDDNRITSMGQLFSHVLKYASVDKLFSTVGIGVISEQIEYHGFRPLIKDRERAIDLSTSLKVCVHAKGSIALKNEERFLETSLHLGIFEGVYSIVELGEIKRNETGLSHSFKSLIKDLLHIYITSPICSAKGFRDTYLQSSKALLSSILHQIGANHNSSYLSPKTGKEIFLSDLSRYDSKYNVESLFEQIEEGRDFTFAIEKLVKNNLFFGNELVLETFRSSYISQTNLLQTTLYKSISMLEETGYYPSFEFKDTYPSVFLSISRAGLRRSFIFNEPNKEEHQEQREFLYLKSREALEGYVVPHWMDFKKSLSKVADNIFCMFHF